jgi:hypothetical protein
MICTIAVGIGFPFSTDGDFDMFAEHIPVVLHKTVRSKSILTNKNGAGWNTKKIMEGI